MTETTRIAFRIDKSLKEEWDRAVEENPEYDSLSHLIRLSVGRELMGQPTTHEFSGGVEAERLEETVSAVQRLEERIGAIDNTFSDFIDRAYGNNTGVEDSDRTAVYEALPESSDGALSASEIAEAADVPEQIATVAAALLEHEVDAIKAAERDGQLVFWREL